jgi:hypothetical protein
MHFMEWFNLIIFAKWYFIFIVSFFYLLIIKIKLNLNYNITWSLTNQNIRCKGNIGNINSTHKSEFIKPVEAIQMHDNYFITYK